MTAVVDNVDAEQPSENAAPTVFPPTDGKYCWTKLSFSVCDGAYRWYNYDRVHKNVFAQEYAQGTWYIRNLETEEFTPFDWAAQHIEEPGPDKNPLVREQRQLELESNVLYVKMSTEVSVLFDSYKQIVYNFNAYGNFLVPRSGAGTPVFPCDEQNVPLFPMSVYTRALDILYTEDNVPVLPVNSDGVPIVPIDEYGAVFPYDRDGNLIWPIDDDGLPYPPLNSAGVPAIRVNENGTPILPFDESGEQLIMFDEDNVPMKAVDFHKKFTPEQAEAWGGGKVPRHLAIAPAPPPEKDEKQKVTNGVQEAPPAYVDPAFHRLPPPMPDFQDIELPTVPPEFAHAMALHAKSLSGKFQMEFEIERKRYEDMMIDYYKHQEKIRQEEIEKYQKQVNEEQERKKRLAGVLKITTKIKDKNLLATTSTTKSSTQELRAEILAKRKRVMAYIEKKKQEVQDEVNKYIDEDTRKAQEEDDKRKAEESERRAKERSESVSSADTYEDVPVGGRRSRSRDRDGRRARSRDRHDDRGRGVKKFGRHDNRDAGYGHSRRFGGSRHYESRPRYAPRHHDNRRRSPDGRRRRSPDRGAKRHRSNSRDVSRSPSRSGSEMERTIRKRRRSASPRSVSRSVSPKSIGSPASVGSKSPQSSKKHRKSKQGQQKQTTSRSPSLASSVSRTPSPRRSTVRLGPHTPSASPSSRPESANANVSRWEKDDEENEIQNSPREV